MAKPRAAAPPASPIRRLFAGPAAVILPVVLGIALLAAGIEATMKLRAWRLQRGVFPETVSLLDWQRQPGVERVELTIAGRDLVLPKFFVTRADRARLDGGEADEVSRVVFELRLPDFRPYGLDSVEQYKAEPGARLYIGLLTGPDATPPQEIVRRAVASGQRRDPNPIPDGKPHVAPRSAYEDWAYAYTAEGGYRLFAICGKDKAENLCDARFMAGPGLAVAYGFARERHLADWPAIDAKVRALLQSFGLTLD